ncbi:MAG: hypothetical protein LUQ71_09185 [Methanoregula sp.]|nr:hypothetical protein [Methanoregula sp.]
MKIMRMFAVLIAAVCILSLLPGAGAMSIQMDPLSTTSSSASVSAGAVSAASANDNYPISVEQARDSVRLFMNDLTLEPTLSSTGSLEVGNYYNLNAGSDSFSVNQNTGVVEFVHFGANVPDSEDLTLTRDEAYAKATEYAGLKYDGFSGKSWKLIVDRVYQNDRWIYNETSQSGSWVNYKAYDFVLREEKDHVLLPNIIHVRVNPQTGSIVDYWGVDRILTVTDLTSTTTLSDAVKSATDYTWSEFKVNSAEGYLAVVTRYQNVENLAWVITLHGSYTWDPEYTDTYIVIVDAKDGSVLGTRWSSIWPESRLNYL